MDAIRDMTDMDLEDLRVAVLAEQSRRNAIDTSAAQADAIANRYARAVGREDGDPWVQPTGAHDAYPLGSVVSHLGKTWTSTTPANVWEPGSSGWREQPPEGSDAPPEWRAPTGAHDAYRIGDRVTFDGAVYESVINGNVWSPAAYPQGWRAT